MDILNGKGESVSKLPGDRRRLLLELKVIWHGRVLRNFQLLEKFQYLIFIKTGGQEILASVV